MAALDCIPTYVELGSLLILVLLLHLPTWEFLYDFGRVWVKSPPFKDRSLNSKLVVLYHNHAC